MGHEPNDLIDLPFNKDSFKNKITIHYYSSTSSFQDHFLVALLCYDLSPFIVGAPGNLYALQDTIQFVFLPQIYYQVQLP